MLHIQKRKIPGGAVIVMALWCSTMVFAEPARKKTAVELDVSTADAVIIHVPAGELNISGTTGQTMSAEAVISCDKFKDGECKNSIFEEIRWSSKLEGGLAQLDLTPSRATQYDDISIVVNVGIPEDKTLTVNLDYGDLGLQGTNACLDVNVKAGNVELGLQEKSLASASLKATIGDVSLTTQEGRIPGRRLKIIGAKLEWDEGKGACHLHAKVRAGNVEVNLE